MIKVVITGAESTGKTRLANDLASHYDAPIRSESARSYLKKRNGVYSRSDIQQIAEQQLSEEIKLVNKNPDLLICDTDFLVFKIWSEYKYGICAPWIIEQFQSRHVDLYVLPHFDIPFEPDPLREHPDERHLLFQIYHDTLEQLRLPYIIVHGSPEERLQQSIIRIDQTN